MMLSGGFCRGKSLEPDVRPPTFKFKLLLSSDLDVSDQIGNVKIIIRVLSLAYIFEMINVQEKNLPGCLDQSRCSNNVNCLNPNRSSIRYTKYWIQSLKFKKFKGHLRRNKIHAKANKENRQKQRRVQTAFKSVDVPFGVFQFELGVLELAFCNQTSQIQILTSSLTYLYDFGKIRQTP